MKGVKSSPNAAYETFPGISADEAREKGYVVVESAADGSAPVYGRYLDGSKLGLAPQEPAAVASKGALINPNDPVVHGQDHNPHADGAPPLDSENKGLEDIITGYTPGDDLHPKTGKSKA